MEIERKYLVAQIPENLSDFPSHQIEQGYLCTQPTVRIRRWDDQYILTIKEVQRRSMLEELGDRPSAIVNREEEFALTAESYARLRSKCDGVLISKTRYCIDLRRMMQDGLYVGLTAELDIFHGENDGLLLVEVEFPNEATANSFVAPEWFGADVSSDPHYRNSYLANRKNGPHYK